MSRVLNWGVLGYGSASKNLILNLKNNLNSKLQAVASVSKYNEVLKNKNLTFEVYNNYEDLINSSNIDIIYVGLANFLHFKYLKKIIEMKKKVLIEKPACLNYIDLLSLKDQIADKIYYKESILYLGHPFVKFVKSMIDNNEIGEIYKINAKFGFNFNKKKFFFNKKKNINLFEIKFGGGAINNYAHYPLSSMIAFGKNKNINKIKKINDHSILQKDGLELHCNTSIIFEGNFELNSEISIIKNLPSMITIHGNKGVIHIENPWIPLEKVKINISKKNCNKKYEIFEKKNLWELELENIHKDFMDKKINPSVIETDYDYSLLYLNFANKWRERINENI